MEEKSLLSTVGRLAAILAKLGGFLVVVAGTVALSAWLTISYITDEREVVEVPDVVGLDTPSALARTNAAGLLLEVEDSDKGQYHERIPRDHIVRQEPTPGTRLKVGRRVRVVLSLGPHDLFVPRVEGVPVSDAQIALHDAGMRVGDLVYVHSETVPENVVIDQEPDVEAGSRDGVVSLLVSSGPDEPSYVTPDLIGRRVERVQAFLENRRFRVKIDYEAYAGLPEGTVVRQKPLAGYPLRRREVVWVWVSRGGELPL